MTNQIVFPAEYGRERGRIASSVQDSPVIYTIYARRRNGDYIDITGASIDAKFELISTGTVYDSTGTFTVTDGAGGEFTWLPSAADLGIAGDYYLQFTIDGERSEDNLAWEIQARLDSDGSNTPTALVALTAAQVALVQAISALTGLVKMAAGSATGIAVQSFMETFLAAANETAARIGILPSYTGNATKVLAVNSGETDVEWVAASGGVTDHGALTGLGDDDHTQYAKRASNLSDLTDAAAARSAIGAGTGNGDVTAGAVIPDNAVVRGDGGEKGVQASGVTIDDSNNVNFPNTSNLLFSNSNKGILSENSANLLWISSFTSIGIRLYNGSTYVNSHKFMRLQNITTAQTVIPNGTGDVTLGLSGVFTCSDGAGGFNGGAIDPTTPGNNFNLFDDGGTNTCQLQVAADGSVTVIRTAGSRTYAVNLTLNWM